MSFSGCGLDIMQALAWNGAWSTITGLRRSPNGLQAGGFVYVPIEVASQATEWTLSRQT